MPIAYVRDTGLAGASGTSAVSGSFGTLPVVGNHVFMLDGWWGSSGTNMTFSDNQAGNTWARDKQQATTEGQGAAAIGSAKVVGSSGTFTITGTAGAGSYFKAVGVEFSGLDATTHLDKTGATGTDGTGQTSTVVTATAPNTQADELVLAAIGAGGTADMAFGDPPSGYTKLAKENDGVTVCAFFGAYKIVSANETSAITFTHAAVTTEGIGAVLATYKASAGGGPAVTASTRRSKFFFFMPGTTR